MYFENGFACRIRLRNTGPNEHLVMRTKCSKWVHGRCAKMKRVTSTLAKGFVCKLCVDTMEGIVEPGEEISFFWPGRVCEELLLFEGQVKRHR